MGPIYTENDPTSHLTDLQWHPMSYFAPDSPPVATSRPVAAYRAGTAMAVAAYRAGTAMAVPHLWET